MGTNSTLGSQVIFVPIPNGGANVDLYAWPVLQAGINAAGQFVPFSVDNSGNLLVSEASGGSSTVAISQATPGTSNGVQLVGTGTYVFPAVGASASGTIPTTALSWTFTVLSGSATFGGRTVTAGFSDSDNRAPAVAINWTTAAASDAYIRYSTT
jgi:hypothetical protein